MELVLVAEIRPYLFADSGNGDGVYFAGQVRLVSAK
jgi:hypothetical protein